MSVGLIVVVGLVAAAFWALAFLVWVGRRERLEKRELDSFIKEAVYGVKPSYRERYLRGEIDLDEFEEHWDE